MIKKLSRIPPNLVTQPLDFNPVAVCFLDVFLKNLYIDVNDFNPLLLSSPVAAAKEEEQI